jgi:hypothetical protein
MKKIAPLILFTIFALSLQPVAAQVKLSDSARITLLTASPWYEAVYSLFGHTANRVQDDSTGIDAVFNYGYFDSSQPHFIYHFIRGETDYVLGVTSFQQFLIEYGYKGQEVVEQELNLSLQEKQELFDALQINALPENCGYRYNYFFDNCATRPRDMVERYTHGIIEYPPTQEGQSFRDLIHEHVSHSPWTKFGIDLIIGSDADREIDVREKMYIPSYLMNSFEEATIHPNSNPEHDEISRQGDDVHQGNTIHQGDSVTLSRPLVSHSSVLLPGNPEVNHPGKRFPVTPFTAGIILLVLTLLLSLWQAVRLDKLKLQQWFDTFLFGVSGLGGIIVFVLMYFSEHPATNPNWNFAWLNPIALFAAFLFWSSRAEKAVFFYHFINFAVVLLFLLLWWLIPQQLPLETIPFALCLALRSGTNLLIVRKKRIKNRRYASSRTLKRRWGI